MLSRSIMVRLVEVLSFPLFSLPVLFLVLGLPLLSLPPNASLVLFSQVLNFALIVVRVIMSHDIIWVEIVWQRG